MLDPVAATDSSASEGERAMALGAEMHIGDLSRQTGCNVETIRYYECIGLLPRPPRSGARYWLYDLADVRRLTFVRRARELGFTLDGSRLPLLLDDAKAPTAAIRRTPIASPGPTLWDPRPRTGAQLKVLPSTKDFS